MIKFMLSYQEWLMAPGSQASTQGKFRSPVTGLQGAQVYLIFFRSSSVTATTMVSARGSRSLGITAKTP